MSRLSQLREHFEGHLQTSSDRRRYVKDGDNPPTKVDFDMKVPWRSWDKVEKRDDGVWVLKSAGIDVIILTKDIICEHFLLSYDAAVKDDALKNYHDWCGKWSGRFLGTNKRDALFLLKTIKEIDEPATISTPGASGEAHQELPPLENNTPPSIPPASHTIEPEEVTSEYLLSLIRRMKSEELISFVDTVSPGRQKRWRKDLTKAIQTAAEQSVFSDERSQSKSRDMSLTEPADGPGPSFKEPKANTVTGENGVGNPLRGERVPPHKRVFEIIDDVKKLYTLEEPGPFWQFMDNAVTNDQLIDAVVRAAHKMRAWEPGEDKTLKKKFVRRLLADAHLASIILEQHDLVRQGYTDADVLPYVVNEVVGEVERHKGRSMIWRIITDKKVAEYLKELWPTGDPDDVVHPWVLNERDREQGEGVPKS